MISRSIPTQWGSIALVSYAPPPIGLALDQLRQEFVCSGFARSHVTLLPPRPLSVPVETAAETISAILQRFPPIDVSLSRVCCFPTTNVIYLEIDAGSSCLHDLHSTLNAGLLAHDEIFEYVPHLTLGCPPVPDKMEEVLQSLHRAWQNIAALGFFRLNEAVLLWNSPDSNQGEWHNLRSWTFGGH